FATIDFIDGYLILSPSGLCCVITYTKSKIRMFRSEKPLGTRDILVSSQFSVFSFLEPCITFNF
ncbi:MAG: hypothetical protein KBA86_09035, partial [Bacteroidales bacterium]|nr:hypothetical protein [Bacteroidales bacterium]